jgi:hypothetical protein
MADQIQEHNPNQERYQYWQTHIEAWTCNGLSQVEYCRQNGLRPNRFTYWKRKFQRKDLPIEFVQVPTQSDNSILFYQHESRSPLRLIVKSDYAIEIPDGFSSSTLEQVLLILKGV